jgi:hypothetical protein
MITKTRRLDSMETEPEGLQNQDETCIESPTSEEESIATEESDETKCKEPRFNNREVDRGGFIHGLAVGLGIGCIATFIIVWISVFFIPRLPSEVTYENLLSIFVYPLIYLLAVGLIALTAGIVREYYARSRV